MVIGDARERRVLVVVVRYLLCGVGQLSESSELCRRLVDRGCLLILHAVKRKRRNCSYFVLGRSDVDDDGTSCHSTSTSLLFERKLSQNLDSLWQCERSTISAQVRKDTPSLIVEKGLGRPKECSDREEDFQQWSNKTEAFFAGVIKEPAVEITTTAIDLLFLPSETNVDKGVQHLEFVLQQMHMTFMALTGYEPNDIVANSRKNPLEARRRLQKRYDPTTGGRKRNFLRTIISPGRCSLSLSQGRSWESYVSLRKLNDEIKLAGLEALVPEELEKHLILHSNHLRTLEDARLEIVTYVEAKFGLTTRDFNSSDTGSRGHSDPMDVDAAKLSLIWRGGCFKCGGAHFQRDCNARKSIGKQSSGKGKQSKSRSKSESKGKSKKAREIERNQRCDPRRQRLTPG